MALFCETCNIGVSSEITMRDHVKGRRHQQAVAAVEKRKAAARCSLYCRDFPPTTTEAALRQYFSKFGNISRVMLEKQRGCYCILTFDNEASVQRALAHTNHRLDNYRLTVRPRKPITTTPGHGRYDNRYSQQQKVKDTTLEEEEAVKQAEHEQLIRELLQLSSVQEQMEHLYQRLRLSEQEVQKREEICQYLHHILLPFFPTCTLHQFGSSVNGFGMHGCDMDLFVDFHDDEISLETEEHMRLQFRPVELPYVRDIRSVNTSMGPLLPSQLRAIPPMDRAKLLSRILTYHGHSCGDVTYIPSARCPIARFVHIPTGIKCDMSVNNRLGLRNTQLLRMCGEERRVRLLVFAVRYWGKWRQVAGNIASGPRLSNYCLSLLVYFYLANTSPPVLPTVQQMADMAGLEEQCFIEGWNCSLPALLGATHNTQTAEELLRGFFQFFSEIDLSASVLIMRSATLMSLQQLLANRELDPVLKDFKVKAMAVQDPFVLSHNITLNVNGRTKDLLAHEIQAAAHKASSWTASADSLWGLPYLFSSHGCQLTPSSPTSMPSAFSAPSSESSLVHTTTLRRSAPLTCSLSLDLSTVTPQVLEALHAGGDYRAAWYGKVRRLLLLTLQEIFLFSVQTQEGVIITDNSYKPGNAAQKSDTQSVTNRGYQSRGTAQKIGRESVTDNNLSEQSVRESRSVQELKSEITETAKNPTYAEREGTEIWRHKTGEDVQAEISGGQTAETTEADRASDCHRSCDSIDADSANDHRELKCESAMASSACWFPSSSIYKSSKDPFQLAQASSVHKDSAEQGRMQPLQFAPNCSVPQNFMEQAWTQSSRCGQNASGHKDFTEQVLVLKSSVNKGSTEQGWPEQSSGQPCSVESESQSTSTSVIELSAEASVSDQHTLHLSSNTASSFSSLINSSSEKASASTVESKPLPLTLFPKITSESFAYKESPTSPSSAPPDLRSPGHRSPGFKSHGQRSPRSPGPRSPGSGSSVAKSQKSPDNRAKRHRVVSDSVTAFSGSKRIRCGEGSSGGGFVSDACHIVSDPSSASCSSSLGQQRNPLRGSLTCTSTPRWQTASVQAESSAGHKNQNSASASVSSGSALPVSSTMSAFTTSASLTSAFTTSASSVVMMEDTQQLPLSSGASGTLSSAYATRLPISLNLEASENSPSSIATEQANSAKVWNEKLFLNVSRSPLTDFDSHMQPSTSSHTHDASQNRGETIMDRPQSTGELSDYKADHSSAVLSESGSSMNMSCDDHEGRESSVSSSVKPITTDVSNGSAVTCPVTSGSLPGSAENVDKFRPVLLKCQGHCRTWNGRKVPRSQLLVQGHNDDLDLERLISHQIQQCDPGLSLEPIVFRCELSMTPDPIRVGADVTFEPCTPLKEFQVFVTFFKSFFPKIVARNLAANV